MIHRPVRAAFQRRDGKPEPISCLGHEQRSYTISRDAIFGTS
jgi:hypothetical protein